MLRDEIVKSLQDMETCLQIAEVESKSWHDFWVVQRALCRAMWNVLTWIVRIEDTRTCSIQSTIEPLKTEQMQIKMERIGKKQ